MTIYFAKTGRDGGIAPNLFALMLAGLLIAGCNRKGASDYLAAGDEALGNTRLADAERNYAQAVTLAPNDAKPYLALGSLYIFEHKPPLAQSELMKALEIEPGNAKAHAMLASV